MPSSTTGRAAWRRPLALTSVVITALALAACSPSTPPKAEGTDVGGQLASDTTLDAAWQQATFANFYKQKIEWRPCTEEDGLTAEGLEKATAQGITEENFDCGRVKAPMNWADPADERTTELAVMRIRSNPSGKTEGGKPLFINPGGPGLTASSLAFDLAKQASFGPVLKEYDVYAVDPRGVGASSPLDCVSSSTLPVLRISECLEKNPLAHFMGTSQVARDMEMMRSISGAEHFDYLGFSYGTVLGATYATLFPGNVGHMALDSALSADWGTLTAGFDQQVAVATEIETMIAECTDPDCPFASTSDFIALRDSLDASPWKGSDGTELSGSVLLQFVVDTLYKAPAERNERLAAIGKAKSGDPNDVDALLVLAGLVVPAGEKDPADTAQSDSAESGDEGGAPMIDSTGEIIRCNSFPDTPDITNLIARVKDKGMPELFGGPEINDTTLSDYIDLRCAGLPEASSDINDSFHAPDVETPILVVGTKGDHATPYEYSQRLVNQLGKARLLTFDAHGHGLSFSGRSSLLDATIADYLLNGTLPEEGTTIADGATK